LKIFSIFFFGIPIAIVIGIVAIYLKITVPHFSIFIIVIYIVATYMSWQIRCPKCDGILAGLFHSQKEKRLCSYPLLTDEHKFCPYCGVSLDEEIEEK
jgi:carbon starvation protein CstA